MYVHGLEIPITQYNSRGKKKYPSRMTQGEKEKVKGEIQ